MIAEFAGQRITCVFRDRIQARPGDTLRVLPDVDRVHLFAHGSGLRLNG